ncbi:hypothetical protein SLS63_002877 [Diaporthe eres]|uniref:Chromo shadow domain-containing protein n=1 Tax=Diaporthe eres TaxID=83184 RepID=A0ABR1PI32_DIAER
MPPAISDDENSDSGDFAVTSDILPKKGRGRKPLKKEEGVSEDDDVADAKVANGDVDEDEDDEEDDEDMEEDEENAAEILSEYFKSIGGREKIFEQTSSALKGRKRGRQSNSATPAEKRSRKKGHPADSTPPATARAVEWKPPSGSWDEEVDTVDMCQDEENGTFIVYLTWKNGKKTQHPKEVVYRRCPQKMLRFYERHIRISRDGGSPVAIGTMTQ